MKSGKEREYTEIGADSVHVSIVSFSGLVVAGAVAGGEERGGVVSDKGEQEEDSWTSNPSKLGCGPSQGQNSRPNHSCYYVSTCCPYSPCTHKHNQKTKICKLLKEKDEGGVPCDEAGFKKTKVPRLVSYRRR